MAAKVFGQESKPRRYSIDLAAQMACCEANYARLCKLMPDLDERDRWSYRSEGANQTPTNIIILVKERARYTTMLEVLQCDGPQQWGGELRLQVRLYHDASMAEVISWKGHRRIQPRYEYPNSNMYQCDEKSQINRFLADWLSHSLRCGRSAEPIRY